MNYLPFISYGVYGATTSTEAANYFASWGIMASLPESQVVPVVSTSKNIFKNIFNYIFRDILI